jgi:hypothetical protein
MLKKDTDSWTEKQTRAIRKLKTATQNLPALVIPSTGQRVLQTDASDKYWSVVLLEDKKRPPTHMWIQKWVIQGVRNPLPLHFQGNLSCKVWHLKI